MPPYHEYNPNPPSLPNPPDPNRIYRFDNTPGGSLAPAFLNFYHRSDLNYQFEVQPDGSKKVIQGPAPSSDDSVILNDDQVRVIHNDPQVKTTTSLIVRRLIHNRTRDYIKRLNCGESGCFKDSGRDVTPTEPFTDQSYALGHFTIYWQAECNMGPRRCELDIEGCEPGKGSEADYELKIYWRLFDIYDFTGWQNVIPFSWTGEDFQVFGEWNTTHHGTIQSCEAPSDDYQSITCQDDLRLVTYYDILYGIVPQKRPCPEISEESVVDSAMGRLLVDGRAWCHTGRCLAQGKRCEPIFSHVSISIGDRKSEDVDECLKRCLVRVFVSASLKCRCMQIADGVPWPEPEYVTYEDDASAKKATKKSAQKVSKKSTKKRASPTAKAVAEMAKKKRHQK